MQNFDLDAPSLDELGTTIAKQYDTKVEVQMQAWRATSSLLYYLVLVTQTSKVKESLSNLPEQKVSPSEIYTGYYILSQMLDLGCTVCARQFEPDDVLIMRMELTDSAIFNAPKWWEAFFDELKNFEGQPFFENTRASLVHFKACDGLRTLRGIL